MSHQIKIDLVPGKVAPTYPTATALACDRAAITEQGTEGGLPIIDFIARDSTGALFVLTLTGRLVNMVSAAVRGVNQRNHGIEEP